jgi:hypothetical protein
MASTGSRGFSFFGRTRIWDNRVAAPIGYRSIQYRSAASLEASCSALRAGPRCWSDARMNHGKAALGISLKHALRSVLIRSLTQYAAVFESQPRAFLTILRSEQFSQSVWRMT